MTGGEYNNYVNDRIVGLQNNPFKTFVHTCLDTVSGLVFLVDAVERRLQSIGTSLRHEIDTFGEPKQFLKDVIVSAIYDMDISLFSGRVKYKPGEQRVIVGGGYKQSQANGRILVYHDNAVSDDPNRFKYPNKILWRTHDGNKPRDQPKTIEQYANVHLAVGIIYTIMAIVLTIALGIAISYLAIVHRRNQGLQLTSVGLAGLVFIQLVVIIYPFIPRSLFCKMAPVLAILGSFLVLWSIWARFRFHVKTGKKIMSKVVNVHSVLGSVDKIQERIRCNTLELPKTYSPKLPKANLFNSALNRPRSYTTANSKSNEKDGGEMKKCKFNDLILTLTLVCLLFILWYAIAGPPMISHDIESEYNFNSDTITNTIYQQCSSNQNGSAFFGALLSLLGCYLIALIVFSLSRQGDCNIFIKNTL